MRRVTDVCTLHRRPAEDTDRYGNPIRVPFEDWPTEQLPVYSIQPARVEQQEFAGGRNPIDREIRLSCPLSAPIPGVDDLVSMPEGNHLREGGPFSVIGEVERWETNPILAVTRHGGMVVRLERFRR